MGHFGRFVNWAVSFCSALFCLFFLFLPFGLLLNFAEGGCGHPSSSSSLVCLLLLYTPTAPASLLGRLNFYIFCFMNSAERVRKNNIGQKFKDRFSLQEECQLQLFGSFISLSPDYFCRTPCFLSSSLPMRFTILRYRSCASTTSVADGSMITSPCTASRTGLFTIKLSGARDHSLNCGIA